jgi:signal transduction histidine kinase
MTRRLVVLMVGLVAGTLLIAGIGTLALAHVRARADTESDLRTQAVNTADNLQLFFDTDEVGQLTEEQIRQRLRQLTLLRRVVDLDGFALVGISADGDIEADELPEGVTVDLLDVPGLRAGRVESGNDGDLVYAAAPLDLQQGRTGVIVLSQQASAGLGPAARYFVLAAIASAVVALLAAVLVGRRVTRPIKAASEATTRIAAGELSTRLPEHTGRSDELAELSRNVNGMAEALERSRALEQQFLLSVSHDLRTPLTSIRGYAEAISDGAGDPRRAAAVISSESRRRSEAEAGADLGLEQAMGTRTCSVVSRSRMVTRRPRASRSRP